MPQFQRQAQLEAERDGHGWPSVAVAKEGERRPADCTMDGRKGLRSLYAAGKRNCGMQANPIMKKGY